MKSCLPHQVKSPTVFKETVFTAGIWTGYDQKIKLSPRVTVIGTTFFGPAEGDVPHGYGFDFLHLEDRTAGAHRQSQMHLLQK